MSISYKFPYALLGRPYAQAQLKGSAPYSAIRGTVNFYPVDNGTLLEAEVMNLPRHMPAAADKPPIGPFGFHLHEGNTCGSPSGSEPFDKAMGHYNPKNMPHPMHAGDFPVLFSNDGYAYMAFYTDRFKPSDIINRAVVIHENPDDFRTQPAGASGKRIACGVVKRA